VEVVESSDIGFRNAFLRFLCHADGELYVHDRSMGIVQSWAVIWSLILKGVGNFGRVALQEKGEEKAVH